MSIKGIFPIDKWSFKRESILSDLPMAEFEILMANKTDKVFRKGENIFWEGTYPAGIFYILEGKVKKYKLDKDGREQIFYVANKGEIMGYHAILSEDRYPDSAAALEESKVTFIPKADFLSALHQSEVLNRRLLKNLSHEFAVLANSLSVFAKKSVRQRLALHLIVLREKYKLNFEAGMEVEINLSRDDLANLVGTARENVVRLLSDFKQDNILETRGRKIIVLNVQKLIEIADYE